MFCTKELHNNMEYNFFYSDSYFVYSTICLNKKKTKILKSYKTKTQSYKEKLDKKVTKRNHTIYND